MSRDPWEEHARWWQDEFTEGVDPEYTEQILPLVEENLPSDGRVLDVGCGDGQVARVAAAAGLDVIGIDPAWAQVSVASTRPGSRVDYVRGGASSLPFRSASFDAVIACLVFEHIVELDEAIAEVARVTAPGGRFLFLLNHPLLQTPGSGWIDDQMLDPPEQYWRVGEYLTEASTVEEVQRGVFIRFEHRPLSRYLNTLASHGLLLERMEEPSPPPGFLARAEEYAAASTIPRLLFLRLVKTS
jgi:SAM-dependent methyltransferase